MAALRMSMVRQVESMDAIIEEELVRDGESESKPSDVPQA